jgi:hypothetical protein
VRRRWIKLVAGEPLQIWASQEDSKKKLAKLSIPWSLIQVRVRVPGKRLHTCRLGRFVVLQGQRHMSSLCCAVHRIHMKNAAPLHRDISALCAAVPPAISGAQGIEMTYKGDTFEIFAKDSPNRLVFTVPGTKGVSVLPHQQVL